MQLVSRKFAIPLVFLAAASLLSGCTDYKKKYDYLNVEHQNLKGRFENLQSERQQLADRVAVPFHRLVAVGKGLLEQSTVRSVQHQVLVPMAGSCDNAFDAFGAVPDIRVPAVMAVGPARIVLPVDLPDDFSR